MGQIPQGRVTERGIPAFGEIETGRRLRRVRFGHGSNQPVPRRLRKIPGSPFGHAVRHLRFGARRSGVRVRANPDGQAAETGASLNINAGENGSLELNLIADGLKGTNRDPHNQ